MGEYYGCGDSLCMFGPPDGGMVTNGGCRCLASMPRHAEEDRRRLRRVDRGIRALRDEVERLEAEVERLTTGRDSFEPVVEAAKKWLSTSRKGLSRYTRDHAHACADLADALKALDRQEKGERR